jgi:hypothetical protein
MLTSKLNGKNLLTLSVFFLLYASVFTINFGSPNVSSSSGASLTGIISDQGLDFNADGTFDLIKIRIQVNVSNSGNYGVRINGFVTSDSRIFAVKHDVLLFPLTTGLQVVTVDISGSLIHSFKLNPLKISSITLIDQNNNLIDEKTQVPLSQEYLFTEFDAPEATITSYVGDRGIDSDGDDAYDSLEVSFIVNVTKSGFYKIESVMGKNLGITQGTIYLNKTSIVSISFDGPTIYNLQINPEKLAYISLSDENGNPLSLLSDVQLSRKYLYTEFDSPGATLTGVIHDRGVDFDENGTFDYLEVKVEVNILVPGEYLVLVNGLLSEAKEAINVYSYQSAYFSNVGLQTLVFSLDGSKIFSSQLNPLNISKISLYIDRGLVNELSSVPLSRKYLYTEFDIPLQIFSGVTSGAWAKYAMNYTWSSTDQLAQTPAQIETLKNIQWTKLEVKNVTNTQIQISQTNHYKNGTDVPLQIISGDLKSNFLVFLIPGNFNKGDIIPDFSAILGKTDKTYAGALRTVVFANYSLSYFGINVTETFYWDRVTGIICEMNAVTSASLGDDVETITTTMKLYETSLWKIVTQISSSTSKTTLKEGESILISGSLNQNLTGKSVFISYRKPSGSTVNRTITTGSNGSYSDTYTLDEVGIWSITASWSGDSSHTAAISSSIPVQVTAKPFQETPLGIATLSIIAIAAITTFIFLRMRKNQETKQN